MALSTGHNHLCSGGLRLYVACARWQGHCHQRWRAGTCRCARGCRVLRADWKPHLVDGLYVLGYAKLSDWWWKILEGPLVEAGQGCPALGPSQRDSHRAALLPGFLCLAAFDEGRQVALHRGCPGDSLLQLFLHHHRGQSPLQDLNAGTYVGCSGGLLSHLPRASEDGHRPHPLVLGHRFLPASPDVVLYVLHHRSFLDCRTLSGHHLQGLEDIRIVHIAFCGSLWHRLGNGYGNYFHQPRICRRDDARWTLRPREVCRHREQDQGSRPRLCHGVELWHP